MLWNLTRLQVRTFLGLGRLFGGEIRPELIRLETLADSNPNDVGKQAAIYRILLNSDPQRLVRRFESFKYAQDRTCISMYLQALQRTNNIQRLVPFIESSRIPSKESEKEVNGIRQLTALLGTREHPLVIKQIGNSIGRRILFIVANVALVSAIGYVIFSTNNQRFAGMSLKAHHVFNHDGEAPVTFKDVQGCDEAKAELEEIVAFLKDPERFSRLGARLPRGVLLVGPPGTGKTLLARAVAGEAGVPFLYASGAEFDELFVGMGSLRIRQMFENAKEQAPAIVFIDELDAIGSQRNPRDPQHSRMSLNQLLVEMDGFSESKGVIVIGATNFPESLDKALLRPGRFDRHVHVSLPDVKGRTQILSLYLGGVPRSKDVDLSILARGTPGFSGADLYKMINSAKIQASKNGNLTVSMFDLEKAKDEMLMGQERRSASVGEEIRKLTAYHEGGHALVAMYTPHAMPVHKATIMPRGQSLGLVAQLPDGDQLSQSKAELQALLDVTMGGRVAEELIFGPELVTTGASSDFAQATAVARAMVTQYGMSEKIGPVKIADTDYEKLGAETKLLIDEETRRILRESKQRAAKLLRENIKLLHVLARALLEKETMSRLEIEGLLRNHGAVFPIERKPPLSPLTKAASLGLSLEPQYE